MKLQPSLTPHTKTRGTWTKNPNVRSEMQTCGGERGEKCPDTDSGNDVTWQGQDATRTGDGSKRDPTRLLPSRERPGKAERLPAGCLESPAPRPSDRRRTPKGSQERPSFPRQHEAENSVCKGAEDGTDSCRKETANSHGLFFTIGSFQGLENLTEVRFLLLIQMNY